MAYQVKELTRRKKLNHVISSLLSSIIGTVNRNPKHMGGWAIWKIKVFCKDGM